MAEAPITGDDIVAPEVRKFVAEPPVGVGAVVDHGTLLHVMTTR